MKGYYIALPNPLGVPCLVMKHSRYTQPRSSIGIRFMLPLDARSSAHTRSPPPFGAIYLPVSNAPADETRSLRVSVNSPESLSMTQRSPPALPPPELLELLDESSLDDSEDESSLSAAQNFDMVSLPLCFLSLLQTLLPAPAIFPFDLDPQSFPSSFFQHFQRRPRRSAPPPHSVSEIVADGLRQI